MIRKHANVIVRFFAIYLKSSPSVKHVYLCKPYRIKNVLNKECLSLFLYLNLFIFKVSGNPLNYTQIITIHIAPFNCVCVVKEILSNLPVAEFFQDRLKSLN